MKFLNLKICKTVLACFFLLALHSCSDNDTEQTTTSTSSTPITTLPASASEPIISCERACLEGFVDLYIDALVANDHSQAPFSANAKFSENAQVLELGDALWGTASRGTSDFKIVVSDTQTSNAGFWMILEEASQPLWLTGRLQVEDGEITELETVIIRSGAGFSGFDHPDGPDPMWFETVSPESRNTREEMWAITDGYMETLEQNLVDFIEFDESCNRIENGVFTANDPNATEGMGATTCRENLNSGMWVYITDIEPRRFYIADEERGIAMGTFMFQQDGSHEFAMVNGEQFMYEGATRRPFTTVIPEMFKIQDGRVYRIMASMTSIPYRSLSGWE
jgi:hypothetical protein